MAIPLLTRILHSLKTEPLSICWSSKVLIGEVCTQVHSINSACSKWFHLKKESSLSFESHRYTKKCQADKHLIMPVTAASVRDVTAEMLSKHDCWSSQRCPACKMTLIYWGKRSEMNYLRSPIEWKLIKYPPPKKNPLNTLIFYKAKWNIMNEVNLIKKKKCKWVLSFRWKVFQAHWLSNRNWPLIRAMNEKNGTEDNVFRVHIGFSALEISK